MNTETLNKAVAIKDSLDKITPIWEYLNTLLKTIHDDKDHYVQCDDMPPVPSLSRLIFLFDIKLLSWKKDEKERSLGERKFLMDNVKTEQFIQTLVDAISKDKDDLEKQLSEL